MKLKDKVIVVTGGSRGIGLSVVRHLMSEGARVALTGTRQETADKAVAELGGASDNLRGYALNVADCEAVTEVFKQIVADFETIHVLVNNAGITKDTLILRLTEQAWDDVLDVNLKGSFNCLKAVTRTMMKNRWGRIINISSVVGLTGNAGQANYAASKAGLLGLTKSAAKELSSRNITVNAVAPGYINTEMTEAVSDEARKAFLDNIPLGRAGEAKEVAAMIAFIASDESSYITGQTFNVDGGLVMQ